MKETIDKMLEALCRMKGMLMLKELLLVDIAA